MAESLLEIRHPDLARLHAIWRLICAADGPAPVDADMLSDFKDNLLIVDCDDTNGAKREIHTGGALVGDAGSDETVAAAIDAVAHARRPVLIEAQRTENKRRSTLVLPFGHSERGTIRIVVAIYPART